MIEFELENGNVVFFHKYYVNFAGIMQNTYNEKEYFVAIKTPNETLKGVKKTKEEATSELHRLLISLKPANETNDITYLLHEIMQNQRVIKNYIKQTENKKDIR